MSYILDALRKSDQLRRRGAAPTLLLAEPTATVPKRQVPLAYGLLGLVLLIAGFAIGWMHPWQRQPTATASPERMVKPPAPSESRVLATAPRPQPQARVQKQASAAPAEAHASRRAKTTRKRVPRKAVATVSRKTEAKLPQPAPSSAAAAAAPAAQAPVAAMNELPLAIQQEMPTLNISVHAYSPKRADRLVDINGRLLHEGDTVAPGLTLERITPDGMILNYKGYTFHRGLH